MDVPSLETLTTSLNPVLLAFIAGCCTWASTGIGATIVLVGGANDFPSWAMETLFGMSAGVMLAASFFSLLGPSVDYSRQLGYAPWLPTLVGFLVGIGFIKLVDCFMPAGAEHGHPVASPAPTPGNSRAASPRLGRSSRSLTPTTTTKHRTGTMEDFGDGFVDPDTSNGATKHVESTPNVPLETIGDESHDGPKVALTSSGHVHRAWTKKRVLLLVVAVTLHNIPEGIVLGVSYGSINNGAHGGPSLKDAILLTIALGLQNIPEGLAVSIPLRKSGMTKLRSLCLGQLSGAVEVLGAIVGAGFVLLVTSILPYALAFAAGCMIYVTVTELLPQSQMNDSKWGTIGLFTGFCLMMTLDTAFS